MEGRAPHLQVRTPQVPAAPPFFRQTSLQTALPPCGPQRAAYSCTRPCAGRPRIHQLEAAAARAASTGGGGDGGLSGGRGGG